MQYPPPPPQQPPHQQYPQQAYAQQPYGQGYPPQHQPGPPRKSNASLIVVVSLLVVGSVVAAGGCYAMKVSRRATQEAQCKNGPTSACAEFGNCFASEAGYGCIAKDAADCRKSTSCKQRGTCGLSGQSCVAVSAEDCRKSTSCAEIGTCDLAVGECRPTKAEHCTASSQCKLKKQCELKPLAKACTDPNAADDEESSTTSSSSSSGAGVTYTCPSGCTYIGGGKCRCRRRR